MKCKRLLYAPNIHQGGGRALLLPLLKFLKNDVDVMFILDSRMLLPEGLQLSGKVYRVKPTLLLRLWCEWLLYRWVTPNMLLLCMGNLPPFFARKGIQNVFVQNRYLIDDISLDGFSIPVRIRLMVERWWLKSRSVYVDTFIVQTATMQRIIKNRLNVDALVLPFVATILLAEHSSHDHETRYDFIYVASGEPHKNHKTLVEAWTSLANKGCYPSLCLTLNVDYFPDLCAWILDEIKKRDLNISMVGECSYARVQQLYRQSGALVYPSFFESFGLPLVEAVAAGLPILASDASYVLDIIDEPDVFDARSSQSIANAVESFCGKPAVLKIDLMDVDAFLVGVFRK